ncbi:MAG: hypothetical protein R6U95_02765 [Bacteroidales bacterium]
MNIQFHSSVLITKDFDTMKKFYQEVLQQEIEFDFGNCIGFKNGISLWKLTEEYPLAQKLGRTFDTSGNKNLEMCFETDNFEEFVSSIEKHTIHYLHKTVEEQWGQYTMRFYDPENNVIEVGESMSCFVKRFYNKGLSVEEVSKRTSVPLKFVQEICEKK